MTNVGNFVGTGASIGTILNIDKVQIRFALSQNDINKIDQKNPDITLYLSGDSSKSWPAKIVRLDSVIDPKTRLVNVIAEVSEPFNTNIHENALRVGTFVNAEFPGTKIADVYALPSSAVLSDRSVYTVNTDKQIQIFTANVLHRNSDSVLVSIFDADAQALNVISRGQGAYAEGMKVNQETSEDK